MNDDELAAIRERAEEPQSGSMRYQVEAANDRTALLAEVDRLRARVAHLEAEVRYLTGETDE